MTISYTLCSFGTFFLVLVSRTKKNLATPDTAPCVQLKPITIKFCSNHFQLNFVVGLIENETKACMQLACHFTIFGVLRKQIGTLATD
jgi:hypothetical protein